MILPMTEDTEDFTWSAAEPLAGEADWLAFGGLSFLVCSASVTFAFGLGRVFQRVGDLRADVDELKQGEA